MKNIIKGLVLVLAILFTGNVNAQKVEYKGKVGSVTKEQKQVLSLDGKPTGKTKTVLFVLDNTTSEVIAMYNEDCDKRAMDKAKKEADNVKPTLNGCDRPN